MAGSGANKASSRAGGHGPALGKGILAAAHERHEALTNTLGSDSMINQDASSHQLDLGPVAVQLRETQDEAGHWIQLLQPGSGVWRRMDGKVMRRAGIEERLLVGEMGVDGRSADTGAVSDCRNGRGQRADLLVQVHRGLGDPPTRVVHPNGATLEVVWPTTDCGEARPRVGHLTALLDNLSVVANHLHQCTVIGETRGQGNRSLVEPGGRGHRVWLSAVSVNFKIPGDLTAALRSSSHGPGA